MEGKNTRLVALLCLTAVLLFACKQSLPLPEPIPTQSGIALSPTPTQPLDTTFPPQVAAGQSSTSTPYLTPTPLPGVEATVGIAACSNNSTFEADVTIPDDMVMQSNTTFIKTWRIRNSGSCDWEGYNLTFIQDTRLSSVNSVPILNTPAGTTVDVSVLMIVPTTPGSYTSTWQVQAPDGTFFGDIFYVRITVLGPTNTPQPTVESQATEEVTNNPTRPSPPSDPYDGQIISGITDTSRDIFQAGQARGNRPNVFSKVGDSITDTWAFLADIGDGKTVWHEYEYLRPVAEYFGSEMVRTGNSFNNVSLAAVGGWHSLNPLSPYDADPMCNGQMPLVCEYEIARPALAVIMIGTNDCGGHLEFDYYEDNLRRIVELSIEYDVIPVLSTIPWCSLCNEQEYNAIIVNIAREYDIPLMDYWAVMEQAPNHGIGEDGIHPNVPPDSNTANFSAENLQYGFTIRNLLTLQTLNAIWQEVIQQP